MIKKDEIIEILDILKDKYPDADCALDHRNNFELICAVALSAQTTDKSVNLVTPELFKKYPDAFALSKANTSDVEEIIRHIGMYRQKAKNLIGMSGELVNRFNGEVPGDYDSLVSLPGVGRKTANVVLAVGFGEQRIPVDTHVFRVANRIGIANAKDVLETELQLMESIPEFRWTEAHHSIIFHGRQICHAKKPECADCPINEKCIYFNQ